MAAFYIEDFGELMRFKCECTNAKSFDTLSVRLLRAQKHKYGFAKSSKRRVERWCARDPLALFVASRPVFLRTLPGSFLNWWFGVRVAAPAALVDSFHDAAFWAHLPTTLGAPLRTALEARAGLALHVRGTHPLTYMLVPFYDYGEQHTAALTHYLERCASGALGCVPQHLSAHVRFGVLDEALCSSLVSLSPAGGGEPLPRFFLHHARRFLRIYVAVMRRNFRRRTEVCKSYFAEIYTEAHSHVTAHVHYQETQESFVECYIAAHFIALLKGKRIWLAI